MIRCFWHISELGPQIPLIHLTCVMLLLCVRETDQQSLSSQSSPGNEQTVEAYGEALTQLRNIEEGDGVLAASAGPVGIIRWRAGEGIAG